MTDDRLIRRCREGDPAAWEALVRAYQGRVYAVALHYLRDREEARDAAQEIFVKVYRHLDSLGERPFLAWLLRLARNASIDRLRRLSVRTPEVAVPAEEVVGLTAAGPSPEERLLRGARRRLVWRALGDLTEINREMIVLKDIQGLRLEEIAELLGLPLGTVKSRTHRARLELGRAVRERRAAEAGG